jgi:hypothetical protein
MRRLIMAGFVMLFIATTAAADCSSELMKLEGYTIIAATQVDGQFEGCDFDKVIRFTDGKRLRCSSYSYTYAYMPDAIIFGKRSTFQGKSLLSIKVLIEDEVFDMAPIVLK